MKSWRRKKGIDVGDIIANIAILGRPVVLKNSKELAINRKTGRPFVKSNKRVGAYTKRALCCLRKQWQGREPIQEPVFLRMTFFLAVGQDRGNLPDISNLYQAPEDLLQKAGIIADDRLVENHDGSRRVCLCDGPCPRKPIYKAGPRKGEPKPNCGAIKKCPFERVEIEVGGASPIYPVSDDYYSWRTK